MSFWVACTPTKPLDIENSDDLKRLRQGCLGVTLIVEALFDYSKPGIDDKIGQLKGVRKRIEGCLARYGFSYTATLHKIANDGLDNTKDIESVRLLLYPALFANNNGVPLEQIYSQTEANDVRIILGHLKSKGTKKTLFPDL